MASSGTSSCSVVTAVGAVQHDSQGQSNGLITLLQGMFCRRCPAIERLSLTIEQILPMHAALCWMRI